MSGDRPAKLKKGDVVALWGARLDYGDRLITAEVSGVVCGTTIRPVEGRSFGDAFGFKAIVHVEAYHRHATRKAALAALAEDVQRELTSVERKAAKLRLNLAKIAEAAS